MSSIPDLVLFKTLSFSCFILLLPCRELYNLCQMFPVAACKATQSVLKDSAHSMEEAIEVKGHAAFPTLDMVRLLSSLTVPPVEPLLIDRVSKNRNITFWSYRKAQ